MDAAGGTVDDQAPPELPAGTTRDPTLERFWATLRRLPRYLQLVAGLLRDGRVPARAKAVLAVGGIYTASPIDLVPGLIPVAGQLDDLFVLLYAVRQAVRFSPPDVAVDHLDRCGITLIELDEDLTTLRATAKWLAAKGVRAGGRLATQSGRLLWGAFSRR